MRGHRTMMNCWTRLSKRWCKMIFCLPGQSQETRGASMEYFSTSFRLWLLHKIRAHGMRCEALTLSRNT